MDQLRYCIADSSHFDTIHRLNYQTFVEEIPQHAPNAQRRLVDPFHHQNTYVICLAGDELVGMLCGRCDRPFSLDRKVPELDRWLPTHRKAVEARLLSVVRPYRHGTVFHGLITHFCRVFMSMGCDLAVVSGTLRQLKLYRHLGFQSFSQPVGPPAAAYQPMFLPLSTFLQRAAFSAVAAR
jgi:Acetyltransferase (GNAT) domain